METTISIIEFNQMPDYYLNKIELNQEDTIILKDGEPLFKILPLNKKSEINLKNSIVFEGDLISPIESNWDSNS